MSQPTNQELYTLILNLEHKIDLLNNKISSLSSNNSQIILPDITIDEWIENANVIENQINILVTEQYGHIEAFKNFILLNNETNKIPILFNKQLSVCVLDNESKQLKKMDDLILQKIIQDIWMKFLTFYRQQPPSDIIEELKDIHMQKVMQMRTKIDNEKNRKNIIKWLKEIV